MMYNKPAMKNSVFLLFLIISPAFLHSGMENLLSLLPGPGRMTDWKPGFEPEVYSGEDLYLYINGGAEIYHEYGFKQVLVQDYESIHHHSLSLEIYEMANPMSAYGIFSFKTRPEAQDIDIGWQTRLDDYYLNCWKGPYLITVTGFDQEPETMQGLQELARKVTEKINVSLEKENLLPDILKRLPEANRIPGSMVYLLGNISFSNHFPLPLEISLSFKEGVKAGYKPGYFITILTYPGVSDAEKNFESLGALMNTQFRDIFSRGSGREICLTTEKSGIVLFRYQGKDLYILTHADSLSQASRIMDRLD
jgi:hypothetical protein